MLPKCLNTIFEKSIFCPKIQFWQNPNIFTRKTPQIFWTIFLVKSKLSTAKMSKTTTFSRVFHPKNRQFSRKIKVEFLDKKWRFRTVWLIYSISVLKPLDQEHFYATLEKSWVSFHILQARASISRFCKSNLFFFCHLSNRYFLSSFIPILSILFNFQFCTI